MQGCLKRFSSLRQASNPLYLHQYSYMLSNLLPCICLCSPSPPRFPAFVNALPAHNYGTVSQLNHDPDHESGQTQQATVRGKQLPCAQLPTLFGMAGLSGYPEHPEFGYYRRRKADVRERSTSHSPEVETLDMAQLLDLLNSPKYSRTMYFQIYARIWQHIGQLLRDPTVVVRNRNAIHGSGTTKINQQLLESQNVQQIENSDGSSKSERRIEGFIEANRTPENQTRALDTVNTENAQLSTTVNNKKMQIKQQQNIQSSVTSIQMSKLVLAALEAPTLRWVTYLSVQQLVAILDAYVVGDHRNERLHGAVMHELMTPYNRSLFYFQDVIKVFQFCAHFEYQDTTVLDYMAQRLVTSIPPSVMPTNLHQIAPLLASSAFLYYRQPDMLNHVFDTLLDRGYTLQQHEMDAAEVILRSWERVEFVHEPFFERIQLGYSKFKAHGVQVGGAAKLGATINRVQMLVAKQSDGS